MTRSMTLFASTSPAPPGVIADEVAWNVIVSYNADGEPASIELDGASRILKDFIAQAAAAKAAKVKR